MEDENIRLRLSLESQDAIAKAKAFRVEVEKTKLELLKISKVGSVAITDAAEGMRRAIDPSKLVGTTKQVNTQISQTKKAISTATAELKKTKTETSGLGGVFSKLGGTIKTAFSLFLGGTFFIFLSRLVNGFKELVRTGEDYAMTIYRLGVSINQLQRRGMDITIATEIALIKDLQKEYEVFSKRSVIDAVASVQMLTRNFGFNQEQIRKTTELSMDLALVQGKDVAETAKMLALFYSSGYGEGLQHAGLAVNRMTVAQEALAMGMKKSYMQLTELERASAAYNLVERQTKDLHEDAMKIQDSIIGQIKEQRSAIENVTNEIALRAIPIELAWLKVKRMSIEAIADWLQWDKLYKDALKEQGKPFIPFFRDKSASDQADELMKKQKEEWEKMLNETLNVSPDLNLTLESGEQESAEAREKLGEQIMDVWNDLEDAQESYNDKSEELEADHNKKLEELDRDSLEDRLQLWEDYQDDLLKIQEDLDQKIVDYQTDFARESVDLDREYQLSIQDSNRKYRENEIKAERDHQQALKRLREEFLFDLEDALRERDALQVLRLIRRYNLDKEQEKDSYEEKRKEMAKAHRLELEDLARQHAEQERINRENLARQIADAQLAAERKREDAKTSFERELVDEQEALQKKKEEEAANFAERQIELEKDLADRQAKILEAFGEEIGVTGTSLQTVSDLFSMYLGEKGVVASVIDQYIATLSNAAIETDKNVQLMMASLASLQAVTTSPLAINQISAVPPAIGVPSHASGVENKLLTRPQLFMAGEVPEVMTITPVSQLNSGKSNGGNGKGTLEILLGSGLEANIIDNTLGQFDIILRKELGKR